MSLDKLREWVKQICRGLELVAAILVLVGIIFSMFSLISNVSLFQDLLTDTSSFREYLDYLFMLIIGIEFLMMLCSPNSDHIIEALIFLVARHMMINDTTPYEDFVSVLSVALLCILRRYLHNTRKEKHPLFVRKKRDFSDGERKDSFSAEQKDSSERK